MLRIIIIGCRCRGATVKIGLGLYHSKIITRAECEPTMVVTVEKFETSSKKCPKKLTKKD